MADKLLAEWFWVDRWMGSSAFLLPLEPRGLYREMLTQAWRRGGRLPNDHDAIRRATGCTPEEWKRAWPKLERYWRIDGDSLVNDTQLEVLSEAMVRQERASERGRKGGKARAQLKHSSSSTQAQPAGVLAAKPPSPSPSPSPSPVDSTCSSNTTSLAPEPARTTWLTPYCEAWSKRWGSESQVPLGEMEKRFSEAEKALRAKGFKDARRECVTRWERFLKSAETSQWARPTRFVQGLGEWGEGRKAGDMGMVAKAAQVEEAQRRLQAEDAAENAKRTGPEALRRDDKSIDVAATMRAAQAARIAEQLAPEPAA